MYAEFANDPKVQTLSEIDQRRFLMVLCLRCSNGDVTLHDTDIAFSLRIELDGEGGWLQTKSIFLEKKLIDKRNRPLSWDKRQFASDSSAERVSKYRAKSKSNGDANVDVTLQKRQANALEAEAEAEESKPSFPPQEISTIPDAPPSASPKTQAKGSRIPTDWQLPKSWGEWAMAEKGLSAEQVRTEADKFADYWRAKPGKDATKLDWQATWRNWIRNAADRMPAGVRQSPGSSLFAGVC